MDQPEDPIRLPPAPAVPARPPFPLIAGVAPVGFAAAIWAVTGNASSLLLAGFSPVIAGAALLDARRAARSRLRAETAAYHEAVTVVREEVTRRHDAARTRGWRQTPSIFRILSSSAPESRWQRGGQLDVVLGSGTVPSGVRLTGEPSEADSGLRDWAAKMTDAPVTADAAAGIGIVGAPVVARSLARSLLIQLVHRLTPDEVAVARVPGGRWEWTRMLPHTIGSSENTPTGPRWVIVSEEAADAVRAVPPGANPLLIATASAPSGLPAGCATVLRLHGADRGEIIRSRMHTTGASLRPQIVSLQQAARFAAGLQRDAEAAGISASERVPIPDSVSLAELGVLSTRSDPGSVSRDPSTLAVPIGIGTDGVTVVDLVRQGPHAVVGGTTGSGKSELLIAWISSMAARFPPDRVTFLLADFKGGAAFDRLRGLPHCVGVITDLGPGEARRALESLRAELRRRERILRDAGARDVADPVLAGALPRLVIVVDEFQALLETSGELHSLFADMAARGRSLGIHLILCSQRPSGVMRDALLANCGLRISLRVNNRADSAALIGSDAAATLPSDRPGRCLVDTGDGDAALCQVATVTDADSRLLPTRGPGLPEPRRPWREPLPPMVTWADLVRAAHETSEAAAGAAAAAAVAGAAAERATSRRHARCGIPHPWRVGLADEPERQRYRVASYDPAADGHLLIVGAARSGKSTLVRTLAAQAGAVGEVVPPTVEAVWDALCGARRHLDRPEGTGGVVVLLDDFDAVFGRWEADYQVTGLELLTGLLREGPAGGVRFVIALQRLHAQMAPVAALCGAPLLLRMPSRDDHRSAGGVDALFDPELPPGGGSWRGARVQVLFHDPEPRRPAGRARSRSSARAGISPFGGTAVPVVSGAPRRTAALLDRAGVVVSSLAGAGSGAPALSPAQAGAIPRGAAIVGDLDAWLGQWSLLAALRADAPVLFDGCGLAAYRSITRRRDLPPVLDPGGRALWVLAPDGEVSRFRFPTDD